MKKTLIPIISLIASVLAFSSCGKEEVMPQQDGQTVVFNVSTELAKTTFGTIKDNVYPILWDEKDTCVYVSVNGGTTLLKAKLTSFNDGKNAKISLTLKDDVKAPYTFILSPTAVGYSGSNGLNIPVPITQTSSATSVDRAAIAIYASKGEIQDCTTPVDLTFKHFAAYGKLALKNLPAGAELQSVTLTAEDDWVGNWYLKVDDGTFTPRSGSTGKALTVNATSAENIWFACAPVDLSNKKIKITAITSKGQYTKTITLGSAHKFISGQVAEFTVNMAGINPDKEEKYTLTAIEDINETDEVVITMKLSDGTYYAMTNDKGTSVPTAASITVSDNAIVNPAENLLWNIKAGTGGYVICPNGDVENILYATDDTKGAKVGNKEGEWIYDSDSDGNYFKFNSSSFTRYLGVYNKQDWRTYTSKTSNNIKDQNLCLFVKAGTPDTRKTQTLSFPKASYEAELGKGFTAPALSGAQTEVTYSSSNTGVATVNATTGAVTLVAAGKTTIIAEAEANETYKAGKASYELTVSSTSTAITTIDDLFAAATKAGSTATKVKVVFNNWVISGVKGSNVYATDGTKGFIIYQKEHGFVAGDKLSGTASCKVQLYNKSAEITELTSSTEGLTVTKGGTVTPVKIAIADLSGINTGAVITFDKLTYDGSVFTDGKNTIKPYNTLTELPELLSGKDYKVTGMYIQYNDTKEIAPRSAEDIVSLFTYLTAEASKTSGISADGETITITVKTNVEGWTVKSDNAAFAVGAKSGNTVPVVVSANPSTTSERTARITVSAEGVDDVVITLKQVKKGQATPVSLDKVISKYAEGEQYAENEKHDLGDGFVIYTTQCHFTTELRIYSSDAHNGFVVSDAFAGAITELRFNAGNKADVICVYGSTDGKNWTLVKEEAVTGSYADHTVTFGGSYTRFKLDVKGSSQVRIKTIGVTYQP